MATVTRTSRFVYTITLTEAEANVVERARQSGPVRFKELVENFINDLQRQQKQDDDLSLQELFNRLSDADKNFIIAQIKDRQPKPARVV